MVDYRVFENIEDRDHVGYSSGIIASRYYCQNFIP